MSRSIHTSTKTIFIVILTISVIANILLVKGNPNALTGTGDTSKLDAVKAQQQELIDVTIEMQQQLASLTQAYQNSQETANQTQRQLSLVEQQRIALEGRFKAQQKELTEAKKTIANQQRLMRAGVLGLNQDVQLAYQEVLQNLSARLEQRYPNSLFRQTSEGHGVIELTLGDLFEKNTVTLRDDADQLLAPIGKTLMAFPQAEISVIGHADSRAIVSELKNLYPTNIELSAARASKVAQHLIDSGINPKQISVIGKSATDPVRTDYNSEAWNLNRRIEITFR
ncbi:OmpA family protein [Reinekea thalattae]|uniref:OmpA family protein n=1 Tax=Reinekea thalattae TaxID=2593301 RepID=A0A5C8Z7C3_9GAMM|nr:OmpA family protein [Reinekea thalattae]TXR53204.1 OmpA family protein [Reinekea thalattae]